MEKKMYYFVALALSMLMTQASFGQRYVKIAASGDPANPTDIFPVIMGDTANGARVDNNTIYQLENGVTYVTSGRLRNTKDWPLQIEAENLTDLENKAILTRLPNSSGTYPDIGRPEGDFTFKNLWIISGERGALENHDWGRIRASGSKTRIVVKDCIIEKDRGGFIQVRADSLKIFIDNCIFRNGGNRRILQGNGRGVDARNFTLDTLVMTNTIVHNIQDRFFRSQGAVVPHNYIMIDHCTSFNTAGRHGHIQLGRVKKAIITNNIFSNPIMLGSSPVFTDEQTQPDNNLHKVITLDTLFAETDLTIAGNNIFWTSDVTDYWATVDTVNAPGILSDLIVQNMGTAADSGNAYFTEVIGFDSLPGSILQYVKDLYANPQSDSMYDFIVEDILVSGTAFDSGNLFDLSETSPCYSASSASATASTTGGAIGVTSTCPQLWNLGGATNNEELLDGTAFKIYPNPVLGKANFVFTLEHTGDVVLEVFDLNGRVLSVINEGVVSAGVHKLKWEVPSKLKGGFYIARLRVGEKVHTEKFILNR
ncbi:MAG: T9SS type A sorting domain-containing protein [Bacteroidia bacterium]|nr:T9SS type A sorting domain-containing protein [Bacteroidia bacterium]